MRVILVNKIRGVICTSRDPEGRKTIYEMVGERAAGLSTVGRLDFNTEGVILMTNDGDLSYRLERPEYRIPRVYRVRVRGAVDEDRIMVLSEHGVTVDGEHLKAEEIRIDRSTIGHVWLTVILKEGRNRHVRRMLESLNLTVARLIRVRFAGLDTRGVRPGRWRMLKPGEIKELKKQVEMIG